MHKGLLGPLFQALKPHYCRQVNLVRNWRPRYYSNGSEAFDPYKVLGLEPGVSLNAIRDQYVKLSKQYHPDYNPGNEETADKFVLLNKAYKILVEKTKKDPDQSRSGGDSAADEINYAFSVEPLGIETEKPEPISVTKALVRIALIGLGVAERVSSKNSREQEKQIIEDTRQAILEYHRKKETLKELYERASR